MSRIKGLTVLCCVVLCSQITCAGQTVMGIDELFRLADENSTSIRSYETGAESADEALKAAKAQRLPEIGISVSASYLGNGRLWDRDFTSGMKIDIPHFGNNFSVEASQVIYAGGAIDGGVGLASLGKKMADQDVQKNRQDIRFLILGYYLDLYKLRNQIKVLRHNIGLTDQVIEEMKARQDQGTVLKNDITRYELQRETLDLQLTKLLNAGKILNFQLVTTLHLPDDTIILPDSTILASSTSVAGDHLDGPITIEVPVLNNNFNWWYVGVGVEYDLSSLFRSRNKIRQARTEVRRAEENHTLAQEHVKTAVEAGYVDFMTSFSDLRTQEKSVELADQNYAVVKNRYENDLALLTDMLDASNMKLSADLALENARINVVYSYYKMKYLSHTL